MTMHMLPAFGSLIERIIGSVLRAILSPIMELVAFLLRTIIGPILETVLKPIIDFAIKLILDVMSSVFYTILKSILELVEIIESSFKIFAGIQNVTYGTSQKNLLEVFLFDNTQLTRAFWLITLLCLTLSIIFAIYAVTRSMLDFDFENKRPVGKILGAVGKAGITFLLIPFFVLFAMTLSNLVMTAVYDITNQTGTTVSDTVFQISAMTANKNSAHNLSSTQTFTSGMRQQYNNGGWKNIDFVKQNFHLNQIDYVVGFILAIFLLIVLATITLTFVQRIFEIMILYVTAPFFVSTMPLDDGAKFGSWRDMFIAKLVSGMGTLILVNLYLMAVPIIMSPNLRLDPRALTSQYLTYDYLLKIIFVAGGALAAKQGGSLITTLVNAQAGQQEQQTMQQTGAMVQRGAMFAGGMALGAAKVAGKVGMGAASIATRPIRQGAMAGFRGAQYALTKKMLFDGQEPPSGGGDSGGGGDTGGGSQGFAGAAMAGAGAGAASSAGSGDAGGGGGGAGGGAARPVSKGARFLLSAYSLGVGAKQYGTSIYKGTSNVLGYAKDALTLNIGGIVGRSKRTITGRETAASKRYDAFMKGNMVDLMTGRDSSAIKRYGTAGMDPSDPMNPMNQGGGGNAVRDLMNKGMSKDFLENQDKRATQQRSAERRRERNPWES